MPVNIATQTFYLLSCMIISLALAFVVSLRYKIILNHMKEKISNSESFSITCMSEVLSLFSPLKIGMFVSKPILTRLVSKIPINKSLVAASFDQMVDIVWQVALLVPMLILVGETKMFGSIYMELIIIGSAIVAILMIMKNISTVMKFVWKFRKLLPARARKLASKSGIAQDSIERELKTTLKYLYDPRMLFKIAIPTALLILIEPVLLQVAGFAFSVNVSYIEAFLVFWISNIIGRLSGIPGGFVSRDITIVGLLVFFGVDSILATQIVLFHRLFTMIPSVSIGAAYLLYHGKSFGRAMKKMRDGSSGSLHI